ncbi:MAG: alpha-ketoglutarate-dependent dioxygenase AlkB [Gammaproteobacteria bacterium]|jgi:alkylated DNA repair dioxygenase AlkB
MLVEPIPMANAEVSLYRGVFSASEHHQLFQSLLHNIPWQQHTVTVYGRSLPAPRLSAWYGDPGASYRYSGLRLQPLPWIQTLLEVKAAAQALAGVDFNSVLLNLYRDGRDSVGWHSDAEPELGRNPVIASVSLGAVRRFLLQHKKRRDSIALALEPGSMLLMRGTTQHFWRHQLPKTEHRVGPRINLTFRIVQSSGGAPKTHAEKSASA